MSGSASDRRKRLRPEDRKTRILSAAEDVFATNGYDRSSMRAVARAAGVTTPVLYDHFTSKADLYATLVDTHADALLRRWADPPETMPPDELFRRTIEAIFAWIEENEHGWRLLFLDAPGDEAVAEARRRAQQRATGALGGLFRRLPLALSTELERTRADQFLAEAAKWSVNAAAAWWWNNRDLSREQIVLLVSDLLWRGLERITKETR
jgi:AcrR family transcriptional regulator